MAVGVFIYLIPVLCSQGALLCAGLGWWRLDGQFNMLNIAVFLSFGLVAAVVGKAQIIVNAILSVDNIHNTDTRAESKVTALPLKGFALERTANIGCNLVCINSLAPSKQYAEFIAAHAGNRVVAAYLPS